MRYIDKSRCCPEFEDLILRNRPTSWNNRRFAQSEVKLVLHRHILAEQQYLCVYCQQSKSRFNEAFHLHPFEKPDIEDFFEYNLKGEIKASAKDPEKAEYMIGLHQLDHQKLTDMRQRQRLLIAQKIRQGLDIDTYLDPTQPELPKFFSMLRKLFGLA